MNIDLERAVETEKLTLEGLWFRQALVLATRIYNNSIIILAPNEDIDNNVIYDSRTGIFVRNLGGVINE